MLTGEALVDTVRDTVLNGRLSLQQPRRGHKAGTDTMLLAAASGCRPDDHFVDVGAGVGTVGLVMARLQPGATGTLVERDPHLADLSRQNVADNELCDRVDTVCLDLYDTQAVRALRSSRPASLAISNPPFYLAGTVRPPTDERQASAYVLPTDANEGHGGWLRRLFQLLKPHGRFVLIHRPDALADLLAVCGGRAGDLRLRAIHPRRGDAATRILFAGRLDTRAPLRLLEPLILHERSGGFTPEAAALHAGTPLVL